MGHMADVLDFLWRRSLSESMRDAITLEDWINQKPRQAASLDFESILTRPLETKTATAVKVQDFLTSSSLIIDADTKSSSDHRYIAMTPRDLHLRRASQELT